MSIAYDSGGRQRPVAVARDDGEEIAIDGTRLKQLRIERGLSVADAARMVTLSREQVEQIENGGLGAFYGARHKLLAVRKYAEGFGLTLDELLPKPAPLAEPAPPPAPEPVPAQQTHAVAEPAAAVEETGAVSAAPAEPLPLIAEAPAAVTSLAPDEAHAEPVPTLSETTIRRLPLALVVGVGLVLVFSILRGLTPEQAPAELPPVEPAADTTSSVAPAEQPQAEPVVQSQPAVTPDGAAAPAPPAPVATPSPAPAASTPATTSVVPSAQPELATPAATAPVALSDTCALTAGPDTPRWAPAQARNSSTRVFVTSSAAIDICVTDANGVATPLKVKPGAMSSASGKPPYVVRSERLSQAQIFLQGLKVRVPSSATAVHLITTQSVRTPETPLPEGQ